MSEPKKTGDKKPSRSAISYINRAAFAKKKPAEAAQEPAATFPKDADPDHFVKPSGKLEKTVNVSIKVKATGRAKKADLKAVEQSIKENIENHFDQEATPGEPGQLPPEEMPAAAPFVVPVFKPLEEMPEGFKEAFNSFENAFKLCINNIYEPYNYVIAYSEEMDINIFLLNGAYDIYHISFFLDPDFDKNIIKNYAIEYAMKLNKFLASEKKKPGTTGEPGEENQTPPGVSENEDGQLMIDIDQEPKKETNLVKYDDLTFWPRKQGSVIRLFIPEEKNAKKEEKMIPVFVTPYSQFGNQPVLKLGLIELSKNNLRMLYERFDELQNML